MNLSALGYERQRRISASRRAWIRGALVGAHAFSMVSAAIFWISLLHEPPKDSAEILLLAIPLGIVAANILRGGMFRDLRRLPAFDQVIFAICCAMDASVILRIAVTNLV